MDGVIVKPKLFAVNLSLTFQVRIINYSLTWLCLGALAVTGTHYGMSDRTVQLTEVVCTNGTQSSLNECTKKLLTPMEGAAYHSVSHGIAGVRCVPTVTVTTVPAAGNVGSDAQFGTQGMILSSAVGIVTILFVVSLIAIIR